MYAGIAGSEISIYERPATAVAALYCLPYAGAGATAFRGWARLLAPTVVIHPVRLPAREARLGDGAPIDPATIAAAIAGHADRPFAIYGHSMGARLGFEVVRELRRLGGPLPLRLYAGAAGPPHEPPPPTLRGLSRMDPDEIFARLVAIGGLPAVAAAMPELRALALPALRADFAWLDGYQLRDEPPLDLPIVVFAGADDPLTEIADLDEWARHSTAGARVVKLPGGHFFLQDQAEALLEVVREDLLDAVDAADRVPLGDTGWSVWRDAVLRSTGFPADGLDRLAAPACAEAADRVVDGATGRLADDPAWVAGRAACAEAARGLAGDPRVREAVTWQNPVLNSALDSLARPPGSESGPASRDRRKRERLIARYWQRYCAKNETIGFFGPAAWVRVDPDPDAPAVTVRPGPGLVRRRRVFLEHWAVQALADRLAADPRVRRWLPPSLAPQLTLRGRQVLRPVQPPLELTALEAAALSTCDGHRPAREVVASLVGLRSEADGELLLERLAERGILQWPAPLPVGPEVADHFARWLDRLGDPALRDQARAAWHRLIAARDTVAAAAGRPDELLVALGRLDEEFTAVTGAPPRRRPGEAYGARGLCYEETERDVDVVFGPAVLDAIAEPLAALLRGARWFTAAIAEVYGRALSDLYGDLAGPSGEVGLAELWYLAQGPIFGAGTRPVDAVGAEFARRWATVFGLDRAAPGTRRLDLDAAGVTAAAAEAFPAVHGGWRAARLHSPDLQLCATDVAALCGGDFTVVLGELHAAWATFDCAVFTEWHTDPDRLRAALALDLGRDRIRPLYPADWPRHTARLTPTLVDPTDPQLGFTLAPGADPARLLPVTSIVVAPRDGALTAIAPDGRCWPLIEVFAGLVAVHAVDGFKLVAAAPHTPRITVDRLVVARETWRTTVGASGLSAGRGDADRFLAARRLRRRLDLPERIFAKLGTETKPVYVDFRSPLYVAALAAMAGGAREAGGDDVPLVLTEMLPGPEHAWLVDAAGHRYFSELRLHVRDREPGGTS